MAKSTVGVAIITHRARHLLARCVEPIRASGLAPRILVVNSSSNDGTLSLAQQMGVESICIPRDEFNHGMTREIARKHLGTDIVVMLTPDAFAVDPGFLERLIRPIVSGQAVVAYARQLPRAGADPIERFNRLFNYPAKSSLRGVESYREIGNSAHFCSNSASAWRNDALDEIGGFETVLVSEETVASARLLRHGHKIAYVGEAEVVHSHPSTIVGDFKRQFDIGYGRRLQAPLLLASGADERRGLSYARGLLGYVWANEWTWLPHAIVNLGARYLGYRLGLMGHRLPARLVRSISGQDFYWTSKIAAQPDTALRRAA